MKEGNNKTVENDKRRKKKAAKTKAVKNILELRKALNLSQEELAFRTGVSRQTISKWEASNCNPTMSSIEAVAKGLNISTSILMCEGEIDFKELAKLYAKQKCNEAGTPPLTLPENNRGQNIDNEISEELTFTHLNENDVNRTPVVKVNEDEIKKEALEEARKNFMPYLYPTLSGNGNAEKARIHKKVIGKILRILIAIILIIYAGFSVYKLIVLSQLIKKIKGLNNINNYYAEIIEYNDTTIKEKNYVWYKDGMFKVEEVMYDDSGIEKGKSYLWIDREKGIRYFCNSSNRNIKNEKIENSEIYAGANYILTFLPTNFKNLTKGVFTKAINPIIFVRKGKDLINLQKGEEEASYISENGIPHCYRTKGSKKLKEFQVKLNCTTEEDVKIAYN